jgi:hypothetical protein
MGIEDVTDTAQNLDLGRVKNPAPVVHQDEHSGRSIE